MVNYACAFSQSELGKYFEWIIINNQMNEAEYLMVAFEEGVIRRGRSLKT